jgi:hypothetical protein
MSSHATGPCMHSFHDATYYRVRELDASGQGEGLHPSDLRALPACMLVAFVGTASAFAAVFNLAAWLIG